nr:protein YhfH [Bacillus massiliglaciei]
MMESMSTLPGTHCPECGEAVEQQVESYLMECDRCLRKREE